jgi:hypothetical protein
MRAMVPRLAATGVGRTRATAIDLACAMREKEARVELRTRRLRLVQSRRLAGVGRDDRIEAKAVAWAQTT